MFPRTTQAQDVTSIRKHKFKTQDKKSNKTGGVGKEGMRVDVWLFQKRSLGNV
jgi:hypothetical protein